MNMIKCIHDHDDCHMNVMGKCRLLSNQIRKKDCPFYRTQEDVDEGRAKAHQYLKENGRIDLIEKFEYNPDRKW